MQSLLLKLREEIQSRPKWQRVLYVAAIYAMAVAVVSHLHGLIAAILSATTAVAFAYLASKAEVDMIRHPRAFVDIQRPTLGHIRIALGGITAVLAVEVGLGLIYALISPDTDVARHNISTTTAAQPGPEVIAVVVLAVVFVGPFVEELLFRNGIQKLLTPRVGAPLAIGLTSAAFAVLHVPSYGGFGAPLASLALPLTAIFASSCIFGVVYYRTENVLSAWLSHGGMNALALIAALT